MRRQDAAIAMHKGQLRPRHLAGVGFDAQLVNGFDDMKCAAGGTTLPSKAETQLGGVIASLLATPTNPIRPVPKNQRAAGSGTGAGPVTDTLSR